MAQDGAQYVFKPEKGQAKDLPKNILEKIVTKYRVVAHTMGYPIGSTSDASRSENHWTIFLVLGDHTAVHLNFRAASADAIENDQMVVLHRQYETSNSKLAQFDFQPLNNVPVGTVLSCVYWFRRNFFELNGQGLGCRHWV